MDNTREDRLVIGATGADMPCEQVRYAVQASSKCSTRSASLCILDSTRGSIVLSVGSVVGDGALVLAQFSVVRSGPQGWEVQLRLIPAREGRHPEMEQRGTSEGGAKSGHPEVERIRNGGQYYPIGLRLFRPQGRR